MSLTITPLAERPELTDELWQMADLWPTFMTEDMIGSAHYDQMATDFPEFALVATDDSGRLVARAFSVPFAHPDDEPLPSRGWDHALFAAFNGKRNGAPPNTVSAIEISFLPELRGQGLSPKMLAAMRDNAKRLGFAELVAPLRPNGKHLEPETPMAEYAVRTRDDGLPADPWIRTHVRAGAVIDSIAPASMVVHGSLADWRAWTGLPFDTNGPVVVPQALNPVHCVLDQDHAVYVEPNVWVRHTLT